MTAAALFQKIPFIKRLVDIRPGEAAKTFLMFWYFSLVIMTIWMLKPVRNSLLLDELGAKSLPYVNLAEGLFLIFIVWAFVELSKRLSKKTYFIVILGFYIACLAAFWILFRFKVDYLSAVFYVWVSSYSIAMTTLFFTLANDIFNPAEAKRLLGFIISGGSLGGVLGGVVTYHLVKWFATEDMLLFTAAVIGLCCVLVVANWRYIASSHAGADSGHKPKKDLPQAAQKSGGVSGLKLIAASSYLLVLAGLVIVAKMTSAVVDNQFNFIVDNSISGKQNLTSFYSGFNSFLNLLSCFMQLVVTRLSLKFLGVGISLWLLPSGLGVLALIGCLNPVLMVAMAIKLFDGSMNYSIQQASREVLYTPVASDVRYKVKPIIDMLGFRGARSLAGFYMIIATSFLGLPYEKIGWLILALIPLWIFLVWRMRHDYTRLLKSNLSSRAKGRPEASEKAGDIIALLCSEKTFEGISFYLTHPSSWIRKLAASIKFLHTDMKNDFSSTRKFIDKIRQREALDDGHDRCGGEKIRHQDMVFLRKLMFFKFGEEIEGDQSMEETIANAPEEALMRMAEILREGEKRLDLKHRAIRILEYIPKQETVDLMLHVLAGPQSQAFRFEIIRGLSRITQKEARLIPNRLVVKSEIMTECVLREKIHKVERFYELRCKTADKEGAAATMLRALADESIERIFLLLKLIYGREIIEIIESELTRTPQDAHIHAHAMELLANTVDPDLIAVLQGVFDGVAGMPARDKDVHKILREWAGSHDHWFVLAAYFVIFDLRLAQQWPEFEAFDPLKEGPLVLS